MSTQTQTTHTLDNIGGKTLPLVKILELCLCDPNRPEPPPEEPHFSTCQICGEQAWESFRCEEHADELLTTPDEIDRLRANLAETCDKPTKEA